MLGEFHDVSAMSKKHDDTCICSNILHSTRVNALYAEVGQAVLTAWKRDIMKSSDQQ